MKTKVLALLMSISLLGGSMPFPVHADEMIHDTYGNGIDWTLSDHVLTISGEGVIFSEKGSLPNWMTYANEIHEIIIEEGITSSQYRAFAELPHLESITFPSTFEQLGTESLFNDGQLVEINGLENIQYFDFRCLSNTEYISEHPFVIHDDTLYYAEGTELTVPDGVKVIAPFAFGNLTAYESTSQLTFTDVPYYDIVLPDGLETIEKYAFAFSSRLCHINIPESVQSIGDYAFFSCPNLEEISLSETCTEIGDFSFFNCRLLTDITMKNAFMDMGWRSCGYNADWNTILKDRAEKKGIDLTSPKYANLLNQIENADMETLIYYDELANWTQLHYKATRSFREIADGQYTDELSNSVIVNDALTVHGNADSLVEEYCQENDLHFSPFISFLVGDVSEDGVVDIVDVLTLNQWYLGLLDFSPAQKLAADFDQNKKCEMIDVIRLLRHLVGID